MSLHGLYLLNGHGTTVDLDSSTEPLIPTTITLKKGQYVIMNSTAS